jgi:TonB family protein
MGDSRAHRRHKKNDAQPEKQRTWQLEQTAQDAAGFTDIDAQTVSLEKANDSYIGVSVFLHILLIVWLAGVGVSTVRPQDSDVFQVDIVTDIPSAGSKPEPDPGQGVEIPKEEQAVETKTLNVEKEQSLPKLEPVASPALAEQEAEKPRDQEAQSSPDQGNDSPASNPAPPGTVQAATDQNQGESAYLVSIWKSQVRGIMDKEWDTPSLAEQVDTSLKTIYLLKVSRSGDLLDMRLLVSSGNTSFDRTVQLALESYPKFPAPPEALMAGHDVVEVTMSFTPPDKNEN